MQFNESKKNNILPTGVVVDNLRVQWAALKNALSQSDDLVGIPCGCHTLNLCLTKVREVDGHFNMHCTNIEEFSQTFNKKSVHQEFELSCPTVCKTRWTNIFDISRWIVCHAEQIIKFLIQPSSITIKAITLKYQTLIDAVYISAPYLVTLLFGFKKLSEKLEAEHRSIADTYPYCISCMILSRRVAAEDVKPILNLIEEQMNERFHKTESGLTQYIAFVLTGPGLQYHHTKINGSPQQLVDFINEKFGLHSGSDQALELANKIISQKLIYNINREIAIRYKNDCIDKIKKKQDIFITVSEFLNANPAVAENSNENSAVAENSGENPTDDENFNQNISQDPTVVPIATLIDQDNSNIANQSTISLENCYFPETELDIDLLYTESFDNDVITEYVVKLAQKYRLNHNIVADQFKIWISGEFLRHKNLKPAVLWDYMSGVNFTDDITFTELGFLAMRLICLPASEATCERTIKDLRATLTGMRARTGDKLCMARLVLQNAPAYIFKQVVYGC